MVTCCEHIISCFEHTCNSGNVSVCEYLKHLHIVKHVCDINMVKGLSSQSKNARISIASDINGSNLLYIVINDF